MYVRSWIRDTNHQWCMFQLKINTICQLRYVNALWVKCKRQDVDVGDIQFLVRSRYIQISNFISLLAWAFFSWDIYLWWFMSRIYERTYTSLTTMQHPIQYNTPDSNCLLFRSTCTRSMVLSFAFLAMKVILKFYSAKCLCTSRSTEFH